MGNLIMPQATRRKAVRHEENLRDYHAVQEEAVDAKTAELLAADKERDDALKAAVAHTAAKHGRVAKELEDYEETFHRNFTKVLTGLMALVTTEAVLLDEEINKEELYTSFQEAYAYLYETDQIQVADSPVFDRLGGRAATYVGGATTDLSDEEISNIISNIYVNDPEMINPLVSNVQDKVASCIKEEKLSVLAKQNMTEDQKLVETFLVRKSKAPTKPLFRKLLEDGVSSSIDLESVTHLSEEATTEVMENSLTTAIVTYTLLECLNTSKLVEFPEGSIDSYINYG